MAWQAAVLLLRQPIIWLVIVVWLALNVGVPIYRIRRLRKAGMPEIDRMSGIEFEQYLEVLFVRLGYDVTRTRPVGDQGGDLVLTKGTDRIVVQAKRHSKAISNKAVQEAATARAHYNCNKAMVVSNQEFTKSARELAESNQVELWGRRTLVDKILQLNGQPTHVPSVAAVQTGAGKQSNAAPACQRCGREMVMRSSARGQFWGCSTFPKCRYTRSFGDA